jgi:hypothetical protein
MHQMRCERQRNVPNELQIHMIGIVTSLFLCLRQGALFSLQTTMLRRIAPLLLLFLLTAPSAHGVVKGSASAHGRFTVRLLGGGHYCSGVVIARNAVVTAGHCALRGGMRVGIVTRATYPSSRLACGHLTRWEPLTVSEPSVASTDPIDGEAAAADRPRNSTQQKPVPRTRMRVSAAGVFSLFGVMRVQSSGSSGSR